MAKQEPMFTKQVLLIILIAIAVGFFLGRVRYKPQINVLYQMVKDRDEEIKRLRYDKMFPPASPSVTPEETLMER